jgi:hypothetical protein
MKVGDEWSEAEPKGEKTSWQPRFSPPYKSKKDLVGVGTTKSISPFKTTRQQTNLQ